MKRRLMIARALIHEPRLLILDEPTAGVDIEIRRSMWDLMTRINEEGMTIILTTHYLHEAESFCRNIAIIDEGRIIENDTMVNVVRKLKREVFVLTLEESLQRAPDLPGYQVQLRNEHEIEVEVEQEQGLNALFRVISDQSLHVSSMRTKSNRLEELFMRLVDDKAEQKHSREAARPGQPPGRRSRPPGGGVRWVQADGHRPAAASLTSAPGDRPVAREPGRARHDRPQRKCIASRVSGFRPSCRPRSP